MSHDPHKGVFTIYKVDETGVPRLFARIGCEGYGRRNSPRYVLIRQVDDASVTVGKNLANALDYIVTVSEDGETVKNLSRSKKRSHSIRRPFHRIIAK